MTMILIRKTPKKRPECSFVGGCCNNPHATDNVFLGKARFVLLFRAKNSEVDTDGISLTEELKEDDWDLLGLLPTKAASKYGQEKQYFKLTADQYEQLEQEIKHHAYEKLLNYLAYRERSLSECKEYLKRLPVNDHFIDTLISKSVSQNYINDDRFAEVLTESQISRNKSRLEAKNSLIKKGVCSALIETILEQLYTPEITANIVGYHLNRAFRKYPDTKSYKDYHKCIAYMMKKGFKYDDFIDKVKTFYSRD